MATINKAYISVALAMGISKLETALAGTSLQPEDFKTPGNISVEDAVTIVRNAMAEQPDAPWPVELGAQLGGSSHGPVGFAALSAPDVATALTTFTRWFVVRCETYSSSTEHEGDWVNIHVTDTTGDPVFERVFFQAMAKAMEEIVGQVLSQADANQLQVHFHHLDEQRLAVLQPMYQAQLFLSEHGNAIRVPNALWQKPSALYDAIAFEQNIKNCEQLLQHQQNSGALREQVKHAFDEHFYHARQNADAFLAVPTVGEFCERFHLTERTFIRKLKQQQTSYKALLSSVRQTHARALLRNSTWSVNDITQVLGYRESANFCRAFKSWTGLSPSEFRKAKGG